jgi:uncharacterized protein (TIGR02117 family)
LRAIAGWAALAIGLFMLAAWIGSSWPRNKAWQEPAADNPETVEILVETNGVHTALVLPLVTPVKDWRATFPNEHINDPLQPYTHVSIGWGDRDIFLNTPTWADLTPATVFDILFGSGEGLVHAAHYVRPAADADIRPLRLTTEQYRVVVRRVEALLPLAASSRHYPGYADYDAFYEARGR